MTVNKANGFILLFLLRSTMCIPRSEFYPEGIQSVGAEPGTIIDLNTVVRAISVGIPYRFYGVPEVAVKVSLDGAIFFGDSTDVDYVHNQTFPINGRKFVAPFWADVDISNGGGRMYYYATNDSSLRNRVSMEIRNSMLVPQFMPTELIIVTWIRVGYFDKRNDKTNTFQCVLASDGLKTYAIFLYADGEIQWTTGNDDGGVDGLSGSPAKIGFNKGVDGEFGIISTSGTDHVIDVAFESNVRGVPHGVYVFPIGDTTIPVVNTCTDVNTGSVYQPMTTFQRDCSTRCTCLLGGQTDCMTLECSYDGPTCIAWGDPHYYTFDDNEHHYQGICQYTHVERCTNSEFSIKTRNTAHSNSVSCVSEVTIEIPGMTIVLKSGRPVPVTIDGTAASMNDPVLHQSNRVEIRRVSTSVHVFLKTIGIKVFWDGQYRIEVTVSTRLLNELCGLCGTYNGSRNDDLQRRDGVVTTSTVDFGDSWLVPGSCTNNGKRDAPGVPGCSTDHAVIQEGRDRCAALKGEVFNSCNNVIDPTRFYESCQFDYCCCSEAEREDCYCDNLAAYAAACAKAGITLSTWRNSFCPLQCPIGMIYQQCGSFCPPTCDDMNATAMCQGGCAEGCFCPTDQVLLDGECVDPFVCTACTHMDMLYQEGEQMQPNCSTRCTCRNREFQCETQACSADGPTCLITGNSHYQTFDFHYYEFQGDCEYILTTPCDSNDFTITAKNIAQFDIVSSVHQVTISIPETNLIIVLGRGNGGSVTINGVLQPNVGDEMIMQSNEVEVIRAGGHPHVFLIAHDVKVFWNGISRVQVTAATIWEDKLCGLCGHYNNDASDDFMIPNGQLVSTADEFSKSWVLSNDTSTCSLGSPLPFCLGSIRTEAINRCNMLKRLVFSSCNSLLDPTPFIEDCVFDYCNCNDRNRQECFCESLAAYAAACSTVGMTLTNWRDYYCHGHCLENTTYHQCGSFCPKTCANAITTCHSGCAEGCFCFDGFIVDDHGICRKSCPVYTSEGDEFFVGFFKNRFGRRREPETIPPVLWVITQESTPVDFTVSTMTGIISNNRAYPGEVTYINIPLELIVFDSTQSNVSERFKGISIKAANGKKLAVFGQNEQVASNDAFLALPVNPIPRVRRQEYILISIHGDPGSTSQAKDSVALIVGTQNDTEVTILPSGTAAVIPYKLAPMSSFIRGIDNSMNTITIDRYQTVYLQVRGGDISGTRVISNKPISVFSGHECANVPLRFAPCDMLVEQIPPIDTWGTEIVTIPFKTRSGDVVKVIASQDSTTVFVTTTNIMDGKTSNVPAFILNAGEHKELVIEDFSVIRSNHPIAVFQFSRSFTTDNVIISDPFMLFVPPYKQYHNSYAVTTAPFNPQLEGTVAGRIAYANYTNIAVPANYFNSTLLTVNNQISNASAFKPIRYSDGSVWGYGAQLMLNGGAQVIRHQNPNVTFLLTVYGFSNQMSYGYSGGSKLESQIARPCNVKQIAGSVVVNTNTVVVTFSADDLGAAFRCKLDKKQFVTCTSPWTQMNVTNGNHRITLQAICPGVGRKKIKRNFKFEVA